MTADIRALVRDLRDTLRTYGLHPDHVACKCEPCKVIARADAYLTPPEPRRRPAVPCPPQAERYRGEGNPHPARVDLRDATEGALCIGEVACPVPGCAGVVGQSCTPVLPKVADVRGDPPEPYPAQPVTEPEEYAPGDRCAECGHRFGELRGVGHGRGECPIDVDGEPCGCPEFTSKDEAAALVARAREMARKGAKK